ncbi:hypothetical protein D3C80_1740120 [compost metagenome]
MQGIGHCQYGVVAHALRPELPIMQLRQLLGRARIVGQLPTPGFQRQDGIDGNADVALDFA